MSASNENNGDGNKKKDKRGILRLDISKPRSSSGSVEFRNQPELIGEASPSPQSQQLSVKWAFPQELANKGENENDVQVRPGRSSHSSERRAKKSLSADYFGFQPYIEPFYMEPIDVPEHINSEDEDYSLSVSAVIQRRASVRGRKKGYISPRRASSPMGHVSGVCGIGGAAGNSFVAAKSDRRRSSVYTTSSGDTAISLGDGANNQDSTKEQIFENIRLHKEVLQSVKMQPWSMRRKLRLVRQAREYIARHEGALQERFAMSRSTKDLWARFKIVLAVKWQHFRRELVNLSTLFVPWQLRIKEIESHFGSVVASYFTFLRWLFWVNIVLAFTLSIFVILPEFLASQFTTQTDHRKVMMKQELENATRLTTFLNFDGYLKYSPLFYGYYSDYSGIVRQGYNLPLAYFFAGVSVYIYSFWATLRKMAENSRMSKLSSKDDECIFSWKLFTGWDFMIGHAETAHNRIASVVLGFKEALLEEAEKKKDKQNWKIILVRIFVNILILCLLVLSASAVVIVVGRSSDQTKNYSYWRRNETSFVMTGISFFFPMCFEFLGYLERYHPRKQLRWQLGRIMLLNLLNLFSLIIALFKKIYLMNMELERLRQCPSRETQTLISNDTTTTMYPYDSQTETTIDDMSFFMTEATMLSNLVQSAASDLFTNFMPDLTMTASATTVVSSNLTYCYRIAVNCSKSSKNFTKSLVTSLFLLNFTTTILPEIWLQLNVTDSTTQTAYTDTESIDTFDVGNMSTIAFDLYANGTSDANETFPWESTTNAFNIVTDNFKGFDEATTEATIADEYVYDYDGFNATIRRRRRSNSVNYENSESDAEGTLDEADYEYEENEKTLSDNENERNLYGIIENMNRFNRSDGKFMFDAKAITVETLFDGDDNDRNNVTMIVSSTVSSFLENTTFTETPDAFNQTLMSEKWTEYLTTISTDFGNSEYVSRTTSDNVEYFDEDEQMINGICYETICEELDDSSSTADVTKSTTRSTPLPSSSTTAEMAKNLINFNSTTTIVPFITSSAQPTNATMPPRPKCIPFTRNGATDNITGIPPEFVGKELIKTINKMEENDQLELRDLCWETLFGQELVKLTVLDLIFTIFTTLFMDFFRALFVRFMNKCWCWDLEKKYPKYGDFKIAENILHLVNNQGQVWMGMFFSPGLAILNLIKLGILMYFRSWAVLTCNVPHEVVFRASRSNNFYLALLLTMLFLCVLPVSYAIVWIEPSWHCGPFANHARIHRVFTDTLKRILPKDWHLPLDIIASPSTVIPLLLLLILIIYYLVSLTGALREANQDLKNQLRRERQEERRKMLQRVVNAKLDDGNGNNAMDRWRKVLEASSPLTPNLPGQQSEPDEEKIKARREFLARIMKKALRKSSNTSEDESHPNGDDDDDETDTEQQEPLPHDQDEKPHSVKRKNSAKHSLDDKTGDVGKARKPSFSRMKEIAEIARKKTDQISDDVKPEKSNVSEKIRKSVESNSINEHEDSYSKVNVVSERRALRRQQNATESEGSVSQITTIPAHADQDTTNYEIVNEKNKAAELKTKAKPISKINTSPEVFKFDKEIRSKRGGDKEIDESDTDQTSYKEIVVKPKRVKIPFSKDSSGSTSISPSPSPSARSPKNDHKHRHKKRETHDTSASDIKKNSDDDRSSLRWSDDQKSKAETPSPSNSERVRQHDEILRQPMKKLNSFLALVREAVHARKQEHEPAPVTTPSNNDIQTRVTAYIDDSTSMSVSEDGTSIKTFDSATTSSQHPRLASTKQKRRTEPPPKPKRQDSQASIWSENIPVITISKTESNECILEKEIVELELETKEIVDKVEDEPKKE